jgi:DNA repair protein RadC
MRDLKKEVFKTVMLDSKNRIIDIIENTEGTINQANPIIREIFHKALELFATALICVHNHPSGNTIPSREDKEFTKTLSEAGKIMQVKVLDHVIIGDNSFYSFADEGIVF